MEHREGLRPQDGEEDAARPGDLPDARSPGLRRGVGRQAKHPNGPIFRTLRKAKWVQTNCTNKWRRWLLLQPKVVAHLEEHRIDPGQCGCTTSASRSPRRNQAHPFSTITLRTTPSDPPRTFVEHVDEKAPAATFAEMVRPTAPVKEPKPITPLPEPFPKRSAARRSPAARSQGPRHPRGDPHAPTGRAARHPRHPRREGDGISPASCGFGPVAPLDLPLQPGDVGRVQGRVAWSETRPRNYSPCSPRRSTPSAKRTTFNAFYTSPVVIDAMHQALRTVSAYSRERPRPSRTRMRKVRDRGGSSDRASPVHRRRTLRRPLRPDRESRLLHPGPGHPHQSELPATPSCPSSTP